MRVPPSCSGIKGFFFYLAVSVFTADAAFGWAEPPPPHDGDLVQESELIVIAHAKDDSIEHPLLVITETLKGNSPTKEIPLLLRDPGVFMRVAKGWQANSGLTVWELGSMEHPICGDLSQDQIWFLRSNPNAAPTDPNGKLPRVMEPGDIQPVELKPYYLTLLSPDPKKALQNLASTNPKLVERAQGSLDYIDVKRIEKIADLEKRIDLLMPYFLAKDGDPGGMRNEVVSQIEACGALGAKKEVPVFFEIKPAWRQILTMDFWASSNYKDAIPTVIRLLDQEEQFWAKQDMSDRSWYPNVPGDLTMAKNDSYNKIYCAIRVLISLGGGEPARKAVLMTKQRWNSYDPTAAHELIRYCDEWLAANK